VHVLRSLHFLVLDRKIVHRIGVDATDLLDDLRRCLVVSLGIAGNTSGGALRYKSRLAPDHHRAGLLQSLGNLFQVLFVLGKGNLLMRSFAVWIRQVLVVLSHVLQVMKTGPNESAKAIAS